MDRNPSHGFSLIFAGVCVRRLGLHLRASCGGLRWAASALSFLADHRWFRSQMVQAWALSFLATVRRGLVTKHASFKARCGPIPIRRLGEFDALLRIWLAQDYVSACIESSASNSKNRVLQSALIEWESCRRSAVATVRRGRGAIHDMSQAGRRHSRIECCREVCCFE